MDMDNELGASDVDSVLPPEGDKDRDEPSPPPQKKDDDDDLAKKRRERAAPR